MAGEIFISYRRADQAKAALLWRLLQERGVEAWYDQHVPSGEDWRAATANALVAAPIFVLMFSKSAAQSDDIAKELGAATFQKKLVIPVRLEDIHPEGAFLYELASRNWFDAFNDTDARLAVLADRLAALVKGGKEAQDAAIRLGAPGAKKLVARQKKRKISVYGIGGLIIAGLAIVTPTVRAVFAPVSQRAAAESSQRVAFFGFTAEDDPDAKALAATATDETFSILNARRIDIAARAETTVRKSESRLERAEELNARYALSGEVGREAGKPRITIRLEDVPTETTLWEATLSGDGPLSVAAVGAAARAGSITDCIITKVHTAETAVWDADLLPLVAPACVAGDTPGQQQQFVTMLRELADKDPRNGGVRTALAFRAADLAPAASPAQRVALLKDAHDALKAAKELGADGYHAALPNFALAIAENRPPLDWAPQIEHVLEAPPKPSETFLFARSNKFAGRAMAAVGRLADATGYFKASHDADPIDVQAGVMYAALLAAQNRFGWQEEFDNLTSRFLGDAVWEAAVVSAVLWDKGDADKLLAAPGPGVPPEAVQCYADLKRALQAAAASARLSGFRKADACLMAYESPGIAMTAAAMLGDLDRAFELVDTPEKSLAVMRSTFLPWFLPAMRAMRADGRFLPLMQKLGYVDYWKATKTQPDICATPAERDIALCAALRAAG